ncbi:probable ATP-dependent RNA helicase ddx56 isoform X2 [Macadamia integrifolia]|uniref:probable ATP-dependent RNA helicase ddx56 isoform X2 n=1 Tax=Macadamia integrifolia TaxID=60698 RepID=UPI001C53115B|nr:probable ATP-dependent RNA helicase ddx56 isoform X2 [Macadamia integrifolia]
MRKIMNLVAQLLRIVLWKTWNLKRKLRKLKHRLRSAFLNAKWELPVLQVHKDILQKLAFSSVQSSRCPNDFSDSEREEPESESDRHEGERSTLQKREEELEHEEEGEEDEQNEEDTTEIKDSEDEDDHEPRCSATQDHLWKIWKLKYMLIGEPEPSWCRRSF